MKKQIIEQFKYKLLKEKDDVLEALDLMGKNIGDKEEFSTELSTYDNHPADIGTELFMVGQSINLKNNEENILYKIDNALDKIKTSNYGICEDCGKKITRERLDILPYASKCIRCEGGNTNGGYLMQSTNDYFNFGRTFKDDEKDSPVNFDGEDSWQSVNDYNVVPNDPSYGTGDYIGLVDEDEIGVVEEVEKISDEYYREQL